MNSLRILSERPTPRLGDWARLRFAVVRLGIGLLAGFAALPVTAQLVPLTDPIDVVDQSFQVEVNPRACSAPSGSFVVSWEEGLFGQGPVRFQRFSAAGTPVAEPVTLELDSSSARATSFGCLPNGGLFVVKVKETGTYGQSFLEGSVFNPNGALRKSGVQIDQGSGEVALPNVACGPAGCVVAWSREDISTREAFVLARTFDLDGSPTSSEIVVSPEPDTEGPQPAVSIDARGGFTVAWTRRWAAEVKAQRFGSDGEPSGPVITIRTPGPTVYEIFPPDLAQDAAGNLFVVWVESESGIPGPAFATVVDVNDNLVGSRLRLDESREQQVGPRVFVDAGGAFVTVWGDYRSPDSLVGRAFGPNGSPMGPPVLLGLDARVSLHEISFGLTPRTDGTFVLAWLRRNPDNGRYEATATLVGSATSEPPAGPWLGSPTVPGYSFKVRISAGSRSIAGAQVPACIRETLCVSGAVPGRSEVFLRVIGPKPNGRMWPSLVKFSTSTVEVWVRQDSSGEIRFYRLEGARPGFDELPGLFDRVGFAPTAAAAADFSPLSGLTVAEPIVLAGGSAPTSDGGVFTSEHFPDFRFRARISAGGKVQEVRKEGACIEETLCLSGAIPGRSEVFLRIQGPKPNGRLWPMIVKLTTSTLEVWVEQISTGETKYYPIEGAAPGKDDLTGLFDRLGFRG